MTGPVARCTLGSHTDPRWWDAAASEREHIAAAAICRSCPLAASCRDLGREGIAEGVLGGLLFSRRLGRRGGRPVWSAASAA
jgi:hypothetical protein